jgi:putative ABC transport system permease protein
MDTTIQDVRYALRRLARSPGFTVVAVLTLAVGIGANSAIFSVVHGVLLRPLPFGDADRLVMLYTGYPDDETRYPLSAPDFMSYHDDARSFEGVAAVTPTEQTLTGRGEARQLPVGLVSSDFFELMRVPMHLGRSFRQEENQPGRNGVAVLSHAYWRTNFGADPRVLGEMLLLNGQPREVVGVLAPRFDFPQGRAIYYPLEYTESFSSTTESGRRSEYLEVVARLAPGVTATVAATEVAAINSRLQVEFPQTNSANINISLTELRSELLGDARLPLLILLGAVGLVLLIACANVANLLLARAAARQGEMAVRTALGAERGRLMRQLLTESVILGALGGTAGIFLAFWGTRALVAARPRGIPRLDEVGIDLTVVAFTALIAIGTGLVFGLVPAAQVARTNLAQSLREGGRSALGTRSANRFRRSLVALETALAVMLLVGAGLLIRSFLSLTAVDPGFRTERIATFSVSLPQSAYPGGEPVRAFYRTLIERLESLPAVESVVASSQLPLSGRSSIFGFDIENREPPAPGFVQDAAFAAATTGYFRAMGIPLRQGRLLSDADRGGAPEVMVVNEAFERRYFSAEDPIGRRISLGDEEWIEIVGVVGDVPQHGLGDDVRPQMYMTHDQFTTRSMTVIVRTSGDPLALAGPIRRELRELDPNLPLERLTTGEQILSESVAQPRFYMFLLTLFAGAALLLAGVGIFGMISHAVGQRTREIGVRIALGADPWRVFRLVLEGAMAPVLAGIVIGILGALALSRLMTGLLYGIAPLDPPTLLAVPALLAVVALIASYLPARRATRVDAITALREV